ncbi:MAG: hypothetical protein LBF59_03090 [Prevotellaceae bacterium]|jgi:predicted DNA-binding protein YlxM (UPF0122 family)|nr:hypothetical protein [Prevotellaceae bacterium]
MFRVDYIQELISGNLSKEGYNNILNSISLFTKKYNWAKCIIVQADKSTYWSAEDIKELTHQFFSWALEKGKFVYLNKIPENYLSYYFSQILMSFVSVRISEEQQKTGLSFEKCKKLVSTIVTEKYFSKSIDETAYIYDKPFDKENIKDVGETDNLLKNLPHYNIPESTKQYKPLILTAIQDIFNIAESPVAVQKLIETVFELFDQTSLPNFDIQTEEDDKEENTEVNSHKYSVIINNLLAGISNEDAKIISEYLFQSHGEISLSELANKYNLPKSTIHHKIETFKKKILQNYIPVNEEDGIKFIQKLSETLDELAK